MFTRENQGGDARRPTSTCLNQSGESLIGGDGDLHLTATRSCRRRRRPPEREGDGENRSCRRRARRRRRPLERGFGVIGEGIWV